MSEDQDKKPTPPATSFLKQNLQGFLQPPLLATPPMFASAREPAPAESGSRAAGEEAENQALPDETALHLRMSQMELANRLKLQGGGTQKAVPVARSLPPGGFGSAQGIMHLRRGDFGKKPQAVQRPSLPTPGAEPAGASPSQEEVLEVPEDSEVRTDRPQRKQRKFQNPSL